MDQNQDELQKAIDDITKKAQAEAAGATPEPTPIIGANGPVTTEAVSPVVNEVAGVVEMEQPVAPVNNPVVTEPTGVEPTMTGKGEATAVVTATDPNMIKIKEQALKDLFPLLEKMNIVPEQKFKIYRDMIETMKDQAVIGPAYEAAKMITDEAGRGEALLYLINLMDELGIK